MFLDGGALAAAVVTKAKQKKANFNMEHELLYGLKVSERKSETSEVCSVQCQFCIYFGKESKPGAKRERTANTKFFTNCKTDNYTSHLDSQHSERWKEYKTLSSAEKADYFKKDEIFANTMPAHGDRETV